MKDLIIFGEDWGGHPSTAQFIAKRLLDKCRILWVDSLGYRVPNFGKKDIRRMVTKIFKHIHGLNNPEKNLFVFTPLVIPLQHISIIRSFNKLLLLIYLKIILKKIGFKNYTLIIAGPFAESMVGMLGEKKSIYYCADDYGTMPGLSPSLVKECEGRLAKKVNLVIVTSENLLKSKLENFKDVFLIPHGVDYDHFSKARLENLSIPEEMKSFREPVIGYHGLIQDLIDVDLLESIAELRPNWEIVLIGEIFFDVKKIPNRPNIHLLGKKSYSDIPNYLKCFNVGLIPYKITRRTIYANPIKLREYLAAGIPVVSTPLPEAIKYNSEIKIAKNAKEFVEAIERFLDGDSSERRQKRMEMMRKESWEEIAKTIMNYL